jgi:hypothetical protein
VKTDINAVTAGQEELRNDMKSVKGNISALETKINAGQEEMRGNQCLSGENKDYRGRPG